MATMVRSSCHAAGDDADYRCPRCRVGALQLMDWFAGDHDFIECYGCGYEGRAARFLTLRGWFKRFDALLSGRIALTEVWATKDWFHYRFR
jgi:hypothetical protein